MSTGVCWINDTDVDSLGLELRDGTAGWLDGGLVQRNLVLIPGRHGAHASDYGMKQPRMIRLVGQLDPSTVTGRLSEVDTVMDHLQGELEVRFGDAPNKVMTGWCRAVRTVEMQPSFIIPDLIMTVEIECDDPVKYDRYGRIVSFGTAGAEVPLGTEQSYGTVEIMGAASQPILYYKDQTGTQQEYMSFSNTLAAGAWMKIEMDRKRIRLFSTGGTETNGMSSLASGDFFMAHPAHGNKATDTWPTLSLSTGTGRILYRRAWGA